MSRKHNKYGKAIVVNVPIGRRTQNSFQKLGTLSGKTKAEDLVVFVKMPPNN